MSFSTMIRLDALHSIEMSPFFDLDVCQTGTASYVNKCAKKRSEYLRRIEFVISVWKYYF